MADDLSYKAEYAKSSRASCKACKENIAKESLRIAKMVQSRHFDGKTPNWFHFGCFFKTTCNVQDVAEISGFDSLRWDDQEKIKGKISSGAAGTSVVDGGVDKSLQLEYAKSSRSSCKACEDKIEKGEVRVGKYLEPSPDSSAFGRVSLMAHWHHVDCFVEKRSELEVEDSMTAEMFPGFSAMSKEDQSMLKDKLGSSSGKKTTKKRKDPPDAKKSKAKKKLKEEVKEKTDEEKKEEENLKVQSKRLWKIRDALKNGCSVSQMREMLSVNKQPVHGGESVLLDRCTDGMAFGALKRCKECSKGQLSYQNEGYGCSGNITEWTKCTFVTKDPERQGWIISSEVKEDVEYLKKFKPKQGKRIFPTVKETVTKSPNSNGKDETDAKPVASLDPDKPLSNLTFVTIGRLKQSKAAIKNAIEELGGSLKDKITSDVTCCLSTKGEVDKDSKKIKEAEKADIPVVSEGYLEAVKTEGVLAALSKHSLVSWGTKKASSQGKKGKRSATDTVDGPMKSKKTGSGSGKPVEKKVKMSVKGGAVVDPDSGLVDVAHVLEVNGEVYNAVLGMVDITHGTNSYYKLQILKKDNSKRCYVFRSWGRVGTIIGGNKLEDCSHSSDEAISKFSDLYFEKTGNHWFNRKNFVKHANRYYPLDIDYGQNDDDLKLSTSIVAGSKSTLPSEVQELVRMIFDIELMKKVLIEFEIDLKKMPLGKLSKKQIESAYSILSEAQKLIEENGSNVGAILDASNRFFTLIPHDFALKKPPLLDNKELIKTKVDMLDNLLDIEVAYSLIKDASDNEDPLDAYYKKLKTHIEPLNKKDEDWAIIEKYVTNTHASTHMHYKLEIEEIFKISRDGEKKRYKPFKDLPNRKLLWHGSRITNYAGILSQGLRIAPPEAPVTGYMFGKGLYFADMISKSANYCNASYSNPTGLMLLCEVALGNMYELTSSKHVTKLPAGKHSVKGCGSTAPDPSCDHSRGDGTVVPCGKGVHARDENTSLLYNEYIVYDVAQVNMQYLLRMKFNYE